MGVSLASFIPKMLNACLAELCICTTDITLLFLPLGLFSLGSLLLIQYLHSIFRVDVTRATPHCGSCNQVPEGLLLAFYSLESEERDKVFEQEDRLTASRSSPQRHQQSLAAWP